MPLYRLAVREGLSSESQRGQIAKEVVRVHCGVTGAPPSFVHAIFLEKPADELPEGLAAFDEATEALLERDYVTVDRGRRFGDDVLTVLDRREN